MNKEKPSYAYMFLYRQGLKMLPSRNFIDKFKEFYIEMNNENSNRKKIDSMDDNTTIFLINAVVESIIYCLDFGFTVNIKSIFKMKPRLIEKMHSAKITGKRSFVSYTRVVTDIPSSLIRKIKNILNKDDKKFQDFVDKKKERYDEIKRYYRKFYGKENEWWQTVKD